MGAVIGAVLVVCLLVVGCSGGSPTATTVSTSPATPTAAAPPQATGTPVEGTRQPVDPTPTQTPTVAPGTAPETPSPGATAGPTTDPSASTSVTVDLATETTELRPGQEFDVDVALDPMGRGISGVQVWIEYDPALVEPVGVEPGSLLGIAPIEAGPIIDEVQGVFQYAAARVGPTDPPTVAGLFATVRFRVLDGFAAASEAVLEISQVKIPDENILEITEVRTGEALRLAISP